jgi:hypothetical protein
MDYSQGKIYKMISIHTDKYYIGSTNGWLNMRIGNHIKDYLIYKRDNNKQDYCKSFDLFDMGPDDVRIELIENFPCKSKQELCRREGELQRQFKNDIINSQIAGRTQKEWYQDNKEKCNKKAAKRYVEKKEEIAKTAKIWYEKNKEQQKIVRKIYYENNKEKYKKVYRENKKAQSKSGSVALE